MGGKKNWAINCWPFGGKVEYRGGFPIKNQPGILIGWPCVNGMKNPDIIGEEVKPVIGVIKALCFQGS